MDMPRPRLHVAIVGAGIAGLTAAIGIARAGHDVTVLEQTAVLGEVFSPVGHKTAIIVTLGSFFRSVPEFKSRPIHLVFCGNMGSWRSWRRFRSDQKTSISYHTGMAACSAN